MAVRRPTVSSVSDQAFGRDEARTREAIRDRAIETLSHQLELERKAKARLSARDLLWTVVLLGAAAGGSYAVVRYVEPQRILKRALKTRRK